MRIFVFIALLATFMSAPIRAVASTPAEAAQQEAATVKKFEEMKKKAASSWPKWYYWDQVGLKDWNSGDRPRAKQKWEYALGIAEAEVRGKKLDPVTARRFREFLDHQILLVQYFQLPNKRELAGKDPREQYALINDARIEDIERTLKYLDRVERLGNSTLGRGHYAMQPFNRIRVKHEEWKRSMKYENETIRGWPIGSYDNGGKQGKTGTPVVIQDRRETRPPDWWKNQKGAEVWKDQRDSHQKTQTTSAKAGYDPNRFKSSYNRTPGTMYVGGKQVKVSDRPNKDNPVGNVAGNSPKEWGNTNRLTDAKKPLPWGQYDGTPRGPDLNAKPVPQLWGTSAKPKDPLKQGWGNNTWGTQQLNKPPTGVRTPAPPDKESNYWK